MRALPPLLPYLLLSAVIVIALGLFLGLNQRVQRLRSLVARFNQCSEARAMELANRLVELRQRMTEASHTPAVPPVPEEAASSALLEGATRGRVLKMHRLGQSGDRIAGALRLPKGDVDLLIKVNRIAMRPYEGSSQ
jgi:hypothetical protein